MHSVREIEAVGINFVSVLNLARATMVRFLRTLAAMHGVASEFSKVSVAAIDVLLFVQAHRLPEEPEGAGKYHVPIEDEGDAICGCKNVGMSK